MHLIVCYRHKEPRGLLRVTLFLLYSIFKNCTYRSLNATVVQSRNCHLQLILRLSWNI